MDDEEDRKTYGNCALCVHTYPTTWTKSKKLA